MYKKSKILKIEETKTKTNKDMVVFYFQDGKFDKKIYLVKNENGEFYFFNDEIIDKIERAIGEDIDEIIKKYKKGCDKPLFILLYTSYFATPEREIRSFKKIFDIKKDVPVDKDIMFEEATVKSDEEYDTLSKELNFNDDENNDDDDNELPF